MPGSKKGSARQDGLQERIKAIAAEEQGGQLQQRQQGEEGESEGSEEEGEEEDSEAGLEIDSGDDDDDEEEEEQEVEEEGKQGEGSGRQGQGGQQAGAGGSGSEGEEEEGEDMLGAVRRISGSGTSTREEATEGGGLKSAGGALGADVGVGDDEAALCASLFRGANIFLAREVPREPLALVIRCAGNLARSRRVCV